ncbi:MAG: LamG domain-containing protein [Paludibacter sp.]|nr:LamG domain-containing protein [Paludibacter sp.]
MGHNGLNSGVLAFPEKSMTLECWLYIDDASGNNAAGVNVISNRHNGNQGFSLNLANNSATSTEDVRFFFKNTKNDGTYDQAFGIYLPRAAFSNQWGHLAFVISSDELKAYAYLNGELYEVIEDIFTSWVGNRLTDQLWIGRWYSNSPTFYGKMADIRVWNVARSASEIAENYNQRLKGNETGLNVYYNFDNFDQTIINAANPGTNNGSLLPATTWTTMHSSEVLSGIPLNLAIVNNMLTWEATGDSWMVECVEKTSGNILLSEQVVTTSYSLENINLPYGAAYFIRVRTFNNQVYSDWATIDVSTTGLTGAQTDVKLSFEGDLLVVNSDVARSFNFFAVDGRLVRSVNLIPGRNEISGLARGFYLAEKQKIVVK